MKKTNTAIILSAVVFPGAGHLYLGKFKTGIILAGISLVSLIYIVSDIVDRAFEVVGKIQNGTVPPDIETINAMIAQQAGGELVNVAGYAILVCWLVGIYGCYQYSKKGKEK